MDQDKEKIVVTENYKLPIRKESAFGQLNLLFGMNDSKRKSTLGKSK